jgi:hypothetical protein
MLNPPGRKRLLAHGRMHVSVYSTLEWDVVVRETWPRMKASAAALDLELSEPIVREAFWDPFGGRLVSLTAGVFDGRVAAEPAG